ncbi:hypothetical protein [Oligoflexus tunisiensis]|uniref:hypothetical protein n=1 Tax=Oligoflexus tunisiensis TaxID=708132 RepID=UPI00114D1B13|nr:hypothetical protein [Oligoflexus tunisiensis]
MTFELKLLVFMCLLGGAACRTYHYYPTYEIGLQPAPGPQDPTLKSLRLHFRCFMADELGGLSVDPALCSKLGEWAALQQAYVLSNELITSEVPETSDLYVDATSTLLAKPSETIDSILNIASFGFYPTRTDRWFKIEIRIFDADHQLLEYGQFKALLREYYGWGYSLLNWALRSTHMIERENAVEQNTRDFLQYFGTLARRAGNQSLLSKGDPRKGSMP